MDDIDLTRRCRSTGAEPDLRLQSDATWIGWSIPITLLFTVPCAIAVGNPTAIVFLAAFSLLPLAAWYACLHVIECDNEEVRSWWPGWPPKIIRWDEIDQVHEGGWGLRLIDHQHRRRITVTPNLTNYAMFRMRVRKRLGEVGFSDRISPELIERIELPYRHRIFSPLLGMGAAFAASLFYLAVAYFLWDFDFRAKLAVVGVPLFPLLAGILDYEVLVSADDLKTCRIIAPLGRTIPIASTDRLVIEDEVTENNHLLTHLMSTTPSKLVSDRAIHRKLRLRSRLGEVLFESSVESPSGQVLAAAITKAIVERQRLDGYVPIGHGLVGEHRQSDNPFDSLEFEGDR